MNLNIVLVMKLIKNKPTTFLRGLLRFLGLNENLKNSRSFFAAAVKTAKLIVVFLVDSI